MTRPVPPERRVYAPIEQLIDDDDPLRRLCQNYTGGLVKEDGSTLGDAACRAGVRYADVAIDGGEFVRALPCLRETMACPLRQWGPRRRDRSGCTQARERGAS